ncbi:MAG: hypothetical protein DWQ47_01160 [Acidobacteria bacterium]|nr:MAG: hypothetical protein DWQ32_11620 [Acidobacteriota bacterium]REK04110.1 MAG: hypothetical protein DWQ38_01145 [Acidobacteriota bacterium]REK15272.1 MAG: hypothetical protein DWQ43_17310 [Acidobacteriota bacterium]REK46362.1 MAG: hypothetical protein DWQ47_01160 [Acidobacteriota bacterium]
MDRIEKDLKEKIFAPGCTPCLSLYQPTHRKHPESEQDQIRFKNLVRQLEESLKDGTGEDEAEALLKPFRELEADREFWTHNLDGLAVLGCDGFFQTYRLQRPVPEIAVAASSFHTKPLLRIVQSSDRFNVLGLDRKKIRLFEGNRDSIDEIELHDEMPRTIEEALGEDLTEPHTTVAAYGGTDSPGAMHHGHGGKSAEVDKDTERFFRAVDKAVWEHYTEPNSLPLILASLPEHQGEFRKISSNKHLLEQGITKHPDSLDAAELKELAWEAFKPVYTARLEKIVEEFGAANANEHGSSDPAEIGRAIAEGRVRLLLIDADKKIAGTFDEEFGKVSKADADNGLHDDLLDDLGEAALKRGAEIVVVPEYDMPVDTGIAAIYRY